MKTLRILLKIMRPLTWPKNIVILAALIFSLNLFNLILFSRTLVAFIIFCFFTGATYLIGALKKAQIDRDSSGLEGLSIARAEFSLIVLLLGTLVATFLLGTPFGLISGVFLFLSLAYYFYLENVVVLDLLTPAISLTLCAMAGGLVIDKFLSPWLIILTFFLGLFFMVCQKKYEERTIYSSALLDYMLVLIIPSLVILYALYALMSEDMVTLFRTPNLIYTLPFVVYGIFRYLYLIQKDKSKELEKIFLTDKHSLINVGLWLILTGVIIYT